MARRRQKRRARRAARRAKRVTRRTARKEGRVAKRAVRRAAPKRAVRRGRRRAAVRAIRRAPRRIARAVRKVARRVAPAIRKAAKRVVAPIRQRLAERRAVRRLPRAERAGARQVQRAERRAAMKTRRVAQRERIKRRIRKVTRRTKEATAQAAERIRSAEMIKKAKARIAAPLEEEEIEPLEPLEGAEAPEEEVPGEAPEEVPEEPTEEAPDEAPDEAEAPLPEGEAPPEGAVPVEEPVGEEGIPSVPAPITHTVQAGDTLGAIAQRFGVDPSQITGFRSGDPNLIFPGEELTIGGGPVGESKTGTGAGAGFNVGGTPTGGGTGVGGAGGGVEGEEDFQQQQGDFLSNYGFDNEYIFSLIDGFKDQPMKTFEELYKDTWDRLGLDDLRDTIDDYTDQIKKLDDKMLTEIEGVNEDPWLWETMRMRRVERIQDNYGTKIDNLVNRLKLTEKHFEQGRDEARDVAEQTLKAFNTQREWAWDQLQYVIKRAEEERDAQRKLKEKGTKILSVSAAKALRVPYGTTEAEAAAMGITPQFRDGDGVSGADQDLISSYVGLVQDGSMKISSVPSSVRNEVAKALGAAGMVEFDDDRVPALIEALRMKISSGEITRKQMKRVINTGSLTTGGVTYSLTPDQIGQIIQGIKTRFGQWLGSL